MKTTTTLGLALLIATGCATTVQGSTSHEEDAAMPDVQTAPDATPTDNSITDTNFVRDASSSDSAITDTTDASIRWPVTAAVSRITPPSRSIPRNSTGVYFAAFDFTSTGAEVPRGLLRLRRVGVGPAADISNVYDYGVTRGSIAETPFRYSTGRAVNPTTHEITIPFNGVREGATATMMVYIDLGSATVGAQHALELVGVTLEDGLFVPFTAIRGNPITISSELAGRLDVQRGSVIGRVNANVSGEAIGSCRLRANRHDLDIVRFSFANGGSVMAWSEIRELELWRGRTRIPVSEWMDPLNGYFVLAPITPIYMAAGTEDEFVIRGRVTAPSGRTIRTFLEYPTDIHVVDRTLNTPAAVCISPTVTGAATHPIRVRSTARSATPPRPSSCPRPLTKGTESWRSRSS